MKRFFHLLDEETERFFIANTKETYVLSEARMRDVTRSASRRWSVSTVPPWQRCDAEAKARLRCSGSTSVLH